MTLEFNYRGSLTNSTSPPGNFSGSWNSTSLPSVFTTNSSETFWQGFWYYQRITPAVVDAGGTLYSYIRPEANNGLNFSVIIKLPLKSYREAVEFVAPLYKDLNRIGINVVAQPATNPDTITTVPKYGIVQAPRNNLFGSRLIPRANWDNETIYNRTFAAIRAAVELGLVYHGVDHYAPPSVAGYPGNMTSISPVWRSAIVHADIMDTGWTGLSTNSAQAFWTRHERLAKAMDHIRAATPGSGAYFNEADVLEPNWQETFFGPHYPRLLRTKRARDPWGLFWAPTTPGSEAWRVITEGDVPTQNGPLCQTGFEDPWTVEEER